MSDPQAVIKKTVEENSIVLFMKGSPDFPQCGFSGRTVQVLKSHGKPFTAVDVLADPGIRQGIKDFSNWPTIPQLYIDGKFVGGCDIVVEMHQNGDLAKLLENA